MLFEKKKYVFSPFAALVQRENAQLIKHTQPHELRASPMIENQINGICRPEAKKI